MRYFLVGAPACSGPVQGVVGGAALGCCSQVNASIGPLNQ